MIWEKLVWLPLLFFLLSFLYNFTLGIIQVRLSLSQKDRSAAIQNIIGIQLLCAGYHICFSEWHDYLVYSLSQKIILLWNVVDSQMEIIHRHSTKYNTFPTRYQEGPVSYLVNSATSHTICVVLGVTAYFGTVSMVNYMRKRYKVRISHLYSRN
jgi:hypothetical protein